MEWTFSPEQDELRRGVRRFFEQKSPPADVRRLIDTDDGYDPGVWQQMADQLGLQGLSLPEDLGGSGFSVVEQSIVLEEMGRALLPSPFFASAVVAAGALLESGDEAAQKELLPGIADGTTIATLALAESRGVWSADGLQTRASAGDDGAWTVNGHKSYVLDGAIASLVLVVADTDAGPALFAVEAEAAGVTVRRVESLDLTRRLAEVQLTSASARLIGTAGAARGIVDRTMLRACVALAAEQVGGAQKCLDMSVDYAKLRVQFGRPIGSFQAIKHKCADMLLEVESARSAAYYAAGVLADGADDAALAMHLAKAYCSSAFFSAAAETIQIHGGIGFTWEHDAHLYYRRAKSSELLFGGVTEHRDALTGLLLASRAG
jgi:alkylation response protein AidB-like acyl-CoA dehydrogenase